MKHCAHPSLHDRMVQVLAHLARSFGTVDKTKLMKLVYLADRSALQSLERPITYDDFKKLKNGPVAEDIYAGLFSARHDKPWTDAFEFHGTEVTLKDPEFTNDLLSEAELDVLDEIIDTYGKLSREELIGLVHGKEEWLRSNFRTRTTFEYEDILDAMGMSKAKIRRVLKTVQTARAIAHAQK